MADVLLSSLVKSILRNLTSSALKEFGIAWGLKTELNNLQSTLSTIQAVLQDAEAKQRKSKALENWLRKLKDAAYDANNLVDEFVTEALRRKLDSERGVTSQVSAFFSLRNRLIFRLKMGHKMTDIRERLDAIAGEKSKFHLRAGVMETEIREMERGQTSSLVNESEIYGRKEEKEMIIEMLLNNLSDHDDVSVYAIWGMGGTGKTTLAQLVYNDRRVNNHFELRIWVCVSDDFDVERLTRAILESIESDVCNISNLDSLQGRLQEKLEGRKFLLILDDVWNECHKKWDMLKEPMRYGAKGSAVIVTTRIQKVALTMAKILPAYQLACLSEDDSWSLFKWHAFGKRMREENLQLELIGKEIVRKCGGLPLAIKALGSLMQFKSSESEWLSVKNSKIWDLSGDESGILSALRLSYEALPPFLRQCFAYCCIFPKDYEMEKDMLIQLWMANDFIPSKGQMTLHDMGHEIIDHLVGRSFLQDVMVDDRSETTCKMHDLMHDLAQSIMIYECSIVDSKGLKIPEKVRHLSFNIGSMKMVPWNAVELEIPSLRSFILLGKNENAKNASPCILKQKYLRVLDLGGNAVEKLSTSIFSFSHLRYLNMSYLNINTLPESVSRLQNLQTLKLNYCHKLSKLPTHMKDMRNLTYLDIKQCYSLTSMPAKMGRLTCLQRLSIFIVGQDEGYQIGELKELNLGGQLSIKGLENVRNSEDAMSANLERKHDLISLNLCWSNKNIPENVEEVLESLQPNLNLKKLSIDSYQGSMFPNWMSGLVLKNVVEISLKNCKRCEHLSSLGKLPALKILYIRGMDSLKYFNHESRGDGEISFPALETLQLYNLPSLEEWTTVDQGEIFPCLWNLKIDRCPKFTKLPSPPTLEELSIGGVDNELLFSTMINLSSPSFLETSDSELNILPDGLFQNLKVLKLLHLYSLSNLKTLSNSLDSLSALKNLYLINLPELENLSGLENLNSLEFLNISDCDSLTSLPVEGLQGLSSLESLCIRRCKKLTYLTEGMQYLTVLRVFAINGCPNIQSFPEGMQHLKALLYLEIDDCDGLFSLPNWLGSLQSLSYLEMTHCRNLRCLPDGLQGLKTLKSLLINRCPRLASRCKKDWQGLAEDSSRSFDCDQQ